MTVAGTEFLSTTPTGAFPFRIARIGTDRVFLRGSASTATARRFWVGVPMTDTFAAGTFVGASTAGEWVTSTVSETSYSASALTEAGGAFVHAGTATPIGTSNPASISPTALLGIATTSGDGNFFAIRATNVSVIVEARNNPIRPGYVEIGRP